MLAEGGGIAYCQDAESRTGGVQRGTAKAHFIGAIRVARWGIFEICQGFRDLLILEVWNQSPEKIHIGLNEIVQVFFARDQGRGAPLPLEKTGYCPKKKSL